MMIILEGMSAATTIHKATSAEQQGPDDGFGNKQASGPGQLSAKEQQRGVLLPFKGLAAYRLQMHKNDAQGGAINFSSGTSWQSIPKWHMIADRSTDTDVGGSAGATREEQSNTTMGNTNNDEKLEQYLDGANVLRSTSATVADVNREPQTQAQLTPEAAPSLSQERNTKEYEWLLFQILDYKCQVQHLEEDLANSKLEYKKKKERTRKKKALLEQKYNNDTHYEEHQHNKQQQQQQYMKEEHAYDHNRDHVHDPPSMTEGKDLELEVIQQEILCRLE
jgi:hypothetical protein